MALFSPEVAGGFYQVAADWTKKPIKTKTGAWYLPKGASPQGSFGDKMPAPVEHVPTAQDFAPPVATTGPVSQDVQAANEIAASQGASSSLAGQTFAPLLDTLQGMGKPTIAPYAPVAPQFENMAPVPVTRPDSSYYQNLFNAKFSPLNQEYFDKNARSDQAVGEAARRGFMEGEPSGVAGQLYEKTISKPYAQAVTDIQNQVNIIRTETEMDLAKYDAGRRDEFNKFRSDLMERDRNYGVASAQAQADIDNTYLALESEIRSAIANGATDEKLAELNARVNTFSTLVNERTQLAQLDQNRALEEARLRQSELESQRNWYNEAGQFAGGLAPSVPFEDLGVPRPLTLNEDGSPKVTSSQVGYWEPGGQAGAPTGDPITYGTATIQGKQTQTGRDGRQWVWNNQRGLWMPDVGLAGPGR